MDNAIESGVHGVAKDLKNNVGYGSIANYVASLYLYFDSRYLSITFFSL